MTKERCKNFKEWEVLAIQDDRKTQFREIVKTPKEINLFTDAFKSAYKDGDDNWIFWSHDSDDAESFTKIAYPKGSNKGIKCPYGKVGDRVWGRESFCIECDSEWSEWHGQTFFSDISPREWADGSDLGIYYPATDSEPVSERETQWRKYSSTQMPREASRILLEITDIRIEILGEITEEDAIAEGIEPAYKFLGVQRYKNYLCDASTDLTAIESFVSLQIHLYGKDFWETNRDKWAWAVTFKRIA